MAKGKRRRERWLEKHFDYNTKKYASFNDKWEPRKDRMLEIMPRDGVSRALEIGCGSVPLLGLMPQAKEKFGIDIAAVKARGLKFKQHNAEDGIPFRPGYFDLVIAGEVIEHIYETGNFLRECRRVLKPDGTLVLSTPNIGSAHNVLKCILGRRPNFVEHDTGMSGHIRHYARNSLMGHLAECGFSVDKFTSDRVYLPLYFYIKPIAWLGQKIAPVIPRYGDSLIVRARKA